MTYLNRDMACKAWLQESRPVIARADKLAICEAITLVIFGLWLYFR